MTMRKHETINSEVGNEGENELVFLANHSKMGQHLVIFVPKQYHETVRGLHNPLKVVVSEAVLK